MDIGEFVMRNWKELAIPAGAVCSAVAMIYYHIKKEIPEIEKKREAFYVAVDAVPQEQRPQVTEMFQKLAALKPDTRFIAENVERRYQT